MLRNSVVEIKRPLDSGRYGGLYIGSMKGRRVAVKRLPKNRQDILNGYMIRDMIDREVHNMNLISGAPHVCELIDSFEDEDSAYLIMELCSGGSLDDHIRTGRVVRSWDTQTLVPGVVYQMLKAIASCHAKRVIHGDIKPDNFMLKQSWRKGILCKLIDFGSSYQVPVGVDGVYGMRYLTPLYASPEQMRGGGSCVTFATDMWSLGIVTHHLLTDSPQVDPRTEFKYISDPLARSFLQDVLNTDPSGRVDSATALDHPWFKYSLKG